MLELAVDGMFSAEYDAARRWGARALETARPLGDSTLIATAAAMVALGGACSGEVAEAQDRARTEVAALVDGLSDDELARRPDTAGYLGAAELELDRFDDAIAHAERGLEVARATGQMAPTIVPTLGTARFMHGLLAESAAVLDVGLETARVGGIDQAIAWSLVNRSHVGARLRRRRHCAARRRGGGRADARTRRKLRLGVGRRGVRRRAACCGRVRARHRGSGRRTRR